MPSNTLSKVSIALSITALVVSFAAIALVAMPQLAPAPSSGDSALAAQQSTSSSGSDGSLLTKKEWPQTEVTSAVPVPSFSVSPSRVGFDNGIANIDYYNLPEQEASAFIEQLKQAGFTFNVHESNSSSYYTYEADNDEGNDSSSAHQGTNIQVAYQDDGNMRIKITNYDMWKSSKELNARN